MERRDARRQGGEVLDLPSGETVNIAPDRSPTNSVPSAENANPVGTPSSVAYSSTRSSVVEAIDVAFEPARHVHRAVGPQCERRRVRDLHGNRLSHAGPIDAIERHGHSGAAVAALVT